MARRVIRTVQIVLPGGKASAESVANIINTVFVKGLEAGERIESIRGSLGTMGEVLTIDIVVSAPEERTEQQMARDLVDDRRR